MTTNEQKVQALMGLVDAHQAKLREPPTALNGYHTRTWSNFKAAIEAAARALVAPKEQAMPGYVMVPVEPTPAMLVALWDHREAMRGQSENRIARAGYAAMLTAATSAPEPVGEPAAWMYDIVIDGVVYPDWVTTTYTTIEELDGGVQNVRPMIFAPKETP